VVRATQTEIEAAVEALRAGDLVAFPTETVYGLGANASNPAALAKIFALKGRPADHPVIVHLDDPRYLHRWVSSVPPVAEALAARFWPGPLTLIFPKAEAVSPIVTGGQDSIGIRIPSHPVAQQLLTAFGGGIAAPSANRYGRVSPTKPEHVREEFGEALARRARRRRIADRARIDDRVLHRQRAAPAAPGIHHALAARGGRRKTGLRRRRCRASG
jgi:L-threonylcarbamoyladenylate synthase